MKFRKKPVVIEAVQILAADYNGFSWDGSPFSDTPDWLVKALNHQIVIVYPSKETDYALWRITTLEDGPNGEAKHIASPGDWIIRGVQGELYACRPDIFEATYEAVKENDMKSEIHPAPEGFTDEQIATDPILHFFHFAHLPPKLQDISKRFCDMATYIVITLPRNAERSVALRKLLEAKDAAVRSNVGPAANSGLPNHALNAALREETLLDRLITERDELGQKLTKLQGFLKGPMPVGVTDKQIKLLQMQRHAMEDYERALVDRIADLQSAEGQAVNPSPKFVHPDDIEEAATEIVNADIDTDGPVSFKG
jgi:hypothetical protein